MAPVLLFLATHIALALNSNRYSATESSIKQKYANYFRQEITQAVNTSYTNEGTISSTLHATNFNFTTPNFKGNDKVTTAWPNNTRNYKATFNSTPNADMYINYSFNRESSLPTSNAPTESSRSFKNGERLTSSETNGHNLTKPLKSRRFANVSSSKSVNQKTVAVNEVMILTDHSNLIRVENSENFVTDINNTTSASFSYAPEPGENLQTNFVLGDEAELLTNAESRTTMSPFTYLNIKNTKDSQSATKSNVIKRGSFVSPSIVQDVGTTETSAATVAKRQSGSIRPTSFVREDFFNEVGTTSLSVTTESQTLPIDVVVGKDSEITPGPKISKSTQETAETSTFPAILTETNPKLNFASSISTSTSREIYNGKSERLDDENPEDPAGYGDYGELSTATTLEGNDKVIVTTESFDGETVDLNSNDNAIKMSSEFPWPVKKEAVVEGDLVLGGLMMVHEREDTVTCGPIMPQGGIQALEAMLYTLDRLNEAPTSLLPNITLGAHILDDCDKDTYGLEMAVDFIKGKLSLVNFLRDQFKRAHYGCDYGNRAYTPLSLIGPDNQNLLIET
ncbi:uncharacterized protein LOC116176265 [Photinus pyralis]|uniref:uncharacterized protein LOC116176264 n=1 Tax=Photinus pyralis TaxID=7054 RepID=UPI0012670192|nr:uncharacterized protein LOC116176264 [Photinus pyralis]XP_031350610.1 uncharacterized protein LOC116176265 [Photinus pyralis]